MISIMLIAKIWFVLRCIAIVCDLLVFNRYGYKVLQEMTYEKFLTNKFYGICEGIVWSCVLWWLVWGQS